MPIEITHITRMVNLQLHKAVIVPPQPNKDGSENPNRKPKVQMMFFGKCIKKNGDRVIQPSDAKQNHLLLGDAILAKFKIEEAIFAELYRFGLVENSTSDWDVIPTYYAMKLTAEDIANGKKEGNMGVWFAPVTLLKLNNKDINYPIIKQLEDKRENAFAKYSSSSLPWQNSNSDLQILESQINAELEVTS